MKSIVYARPGLALADRPEPSVIGTDEVKIRIAFASLCGSDLHVLRGDFDSSIGDAPQFPLGHEASGEVVELGSAATVKGLEVGDKVTFYFNHYCGTCSFCRTGQEQFCSAVRSTSGFMSEYVVCQEQEVFALPADADMAAAALVEPLTVAMRGVDLARIVSGRTLAVSGGGGIGQIVASLGRLAGATNITVIEPIRDKREIALARGADHVIDPSNEDVAARALDITSGRGFDHVIETAGASGAPRTSMEIAARGATVVLLATYRPDLILSIPLGRAFVDEVTVVTGVYQSPYLFPRAIALSGRLGLEELTTRFEPEEFEAGFAAQRDGSTIKTVFAFHDTH
jgi:(R,R)-butanediol dehydrogenase/meso-butanediol dehydrogenase/diacetyl reductase/L-iditol 2-dehydrogenase